MRTNIDIDDDLLAQAQKASGRPTKRAVVEEALKLLVATRGQAQIARLFGAVRWHGNLPESRRARIDRSR